ncbi:Exocyst complex component 5 [Orobanche gracilis]
MARPHAAVTAHLTAVTQILTAIGGLRLKRDITEYGEFVRSFNAPTVDEKFELLGSLANVFIVAPESLSTLFEGTPSIRKDAQSCLFSLETTTRAQSWQLDSARCGPALVNESEDWDGICGHVFGALACEVEALGLFCSAQ